MSTTMTLRHGSSLETRPSLLRRLQSGEDEECWQDFYAIYEGLIGSFAAKAGLTSEEAEEVVQETVIGVSRRLPQFVYDPKVCRFKTWLLNQARWQILRLLKRRSNPASASHPGASPGLSPRSNHPSDETFGTDAMASIPDPSLPDFGAQWDQEWEKGLLTRALERVSKEIDERQFQIFDLYVTKGWPAGRVAKMLSVSVARVYLTKHRVGALLKNEVRRLERAAEQALRKLD
jgi:RNA polymerase sigma-70 factor (ECF subfamily)